MKDNIMKEFMIAESKYFRIVLSNLEELMHLERIVKTYKTLYLFCDTENKQH